jgi:carboxypeptidase family protein
MGSLHTAQRTVAAFAMLLATSTVTGAQEQQAAIAGVVRDSVGSVIAGVSLVAKSQTGVVVELRTTADGIYRVSSLPPGSYELTAALEGFVPVKVTGIELRLGRELTIDLVLRPAGPTETVVVTSDSPLVAITQSARTTNLRADEIEAMPKGRDFTSLATQAAGANDERKSGGLSVDGSSAAENRFIIDGAESTDLGNGLSGERLVTDFVEELQVKSSGYSAEYGGSTGAVLNVVTKSGTNTWHGDGLLYWSGDALDAHSRPTLQLNATNPDVAEYVTYPEDPYHRLEPGFTLGGPLARDRVWMFAGYVPSFQSVRRTVSFLADGTTATFKQSTDIHNVVGNVMATLGSRGRVRAAFNNGGQEEHGLLPALDGSGNPEASYDIGTLTPSRSASLGVDYAPNAKLLLGMRAGYFMNDLSNEGVYQGDRYTYRTSAVGFPGVPPAFQQPRGFGNIPGGANVGVDHARAQRAAVVVDGTLFFSAVGQHRLKGGLQIDRNSYDELSGATGNGINVFWGLGLGGDRGPFGYYTLTSNRVLPNLGAITQGIASVINTGLFVQDSWRVTDRLTVNVGLRTENERVPSFSDDPRIPSTAIHFGFGDKLAPRLGFALDLAGDGKTKAYGSWGVFYDIMKLSLPFSYFGGAKALVYSYSLDTGDLSKIVDNPECPPACPGRLLTHPRDVVPPANDPDNNQIDPDLGQMRMQEAVAGLERELRPNLSVGVRYIHKQLDRGIEDIGFPDQDGVVTYTIGNPGLGKAAAFYPVGGSSLVSYPKARRTYDAVETTFDRRLSRNWSARASYTWSRLWGSYSGLSQSDEDGRVTPNTGFNYDYPMMPFDEHGLPVYGVLATDRPHQLKANAVVHLSFGTSLGVQAFAASGVPRTRVAQFVPSEGGVDLMYRGRNSDGRLPWVRQLDLYVQHQIHAGARWRLSVNADISNVFNGSTPSTYHARELFQGQAIEVDEPEFYARGVDTERLIAEQELVRDARFLMDSGYQAPRSLRVGVKIGF